MYAETMNDFKSGPPDALLLLTTRCPHCPTVLQGLAELVKQGVIGRLEAVNIAARPEVAARYGVRSVPWIRLGEFELQGLHSAAELRQWAQRAGSEAGVAEYYADLLKHGQLAGVLAAVQNNPQRLSALLLLAADPDTELAVRVGVSAVMEDFAASEALRSQLSTLIALGRHDDPRVRADASHFLALTASPDAVAPLQALSGDPERSVRDVARDSLKELQQALQR
jgi:thioredoxin-like negative regulator of GroEL